MGKGQGWSWNVNKKCSLIRNGLVSSSNPRHSNDMALLKVESWGGRHSRDCCRGRLENCFLRRTSKHRDYFSVLSDWGFFLLHSGVIDVPIIYPRTATNAGLLFLQRKMLNTSLKEEQWSLNHVKRGRFQSLVDNEDNSDIFFPAVSEMEI